MQRNYILTGYIILYLFQMPLEEQLWYHGEIPRDTALQLIKNDGDCLVRFSNTKDAHILTAKWEGQVKHFVIEKLDHQVSMNVAV